LFTGSQDRFGNTLFFFAPGFSLILFIIVGPIAFLYVMMFFQWNLHNPFQNYPVFVGINNFITIFTQDHDFWYAWYLTALFTAVVVPVEFVLGFALALALNRKIGFERIVKSLILLPLALSPVAAGALWRVMFSPLYGVIDYFLRLLAIPAQPWASSVSQALLSVEIVDIWEWTPFMALILLSGLASLSGEVLEAAAIDGAGIISTFFNIILPMMRNVILIAVVLRIMDAIKVFDVIFSLTWFGPGNATLLITKYLSITAFGYWELGLAAAESFVTVTMISFVIVLFMRLVREARVEKTI
jgi:multiple sugar transport system permease protein